MGEPAGEVAGRTISSHLGEGLDHCVEAGVAELVSPLIRHLLESVRTGRQQFIGPQGATQQDCAPISRHRTPDDITGALERRRGLGGCLLRDAQALAKLVDGAPVGTDCPEGESVQRPGVGVTPLGKLGVECFDGLLECAGQQEHNAPSRFAHVTPFPIDNCIDDNGSSSLW